MAVRGGGIVLGDKELEAKLLQLEPRLFKRTMRNATTRAMKPVVLEAKRRAHNVKDTGLLAKSIGHRTKQYRARSATVTVVGPREGFKREVQRRLSLRSAPADPLKYAHLVEFGTQAHLIQPSGGKLLQFLVKTGEGVKRVVARAVWHPGTTAQPFLRPALDMKRTQVLHIYREELRRGVDREAKRKR